MNKLKTSLFAILIIQAFVFSSCHEDFLIVRTLYRNGIYIDSNRIVFIHTIKASQPPKGISRFPDGGMHKTVYKNTSLYFLDLKNKTLERMDDFGYCPIEKWITNISAYQDTIVYSVHPGMGWEWQRKNALNPNAYINLEKKFGGIFLYDITTQQKERLTQKGSKPEIFDKGRNILYLTQDSMSNSIWSLNLKSKQKQLIYQTDPSNEIYSYQWNNNSVLINENKKQLTVNPEGEIIRTEVEFLREKRDLLNRAFFDSVLTNIKYSDWGFELKEQWQKSKNEYYRDIMLLNGNFAYRKAIIEEFGNEFSKKEIEKLIRQMDKQSKRLDGYQKTKYDYTSKETIELLKRLIE